MDPQVQSQDDTYDIAQQAVSDATTSSFSSGIDIKKVGSRVKQIYPTGVASDGRRYIDIPDEEIGSKFLLKNGDKGLQAIGFANAGDTKEAATLRKEFNALQEIKDFKNARDSWNRASEVPNDGSGDLTLIYSYIKALDPNSVVREGEIDISRATGSVPENLITSYKRVKEGKLLADQQRAEYQSEVGRIYNYKAKIAQQSQAHYSGLASDMGANPEDVVGGIGKIELADLPELPDISQTQKQGLGPVGLLLGAANKASDFLIPEKKRTFLEGGFQELFQKISERAAKQPSGKGNIGQSLKNVGSSFLPDIADISKTAIRAATELAILKGVGGLAKGTVKKVSSKLPTNLPSVKDLITKGPSGAVDEMRSKAIEIAKQKGLTIDGRQAVKVGKEYLKNIPLSKGVAKQIFPTLNKAKMGVDETVQKA